MSKQSTEVDSYIAAAPDYARPILKKIRALFHRACPSVEETMKWSTPHFEYKGVLAGMSAFKKYVSVGFWKEKLMKDPQGLFAGKSGMNPAKIADVKEMPSDQVLLAYIREAVALNEKGVKLAKPKKKPKPPVDTPEDFLAALRKNPKALAAFEAFSPSHRREYVEWITEAKQTATRQQRLATAVEWIAEGKSRHWKYQRPK